MDAAGAPAPPLPLAVDLDGTLLRTDVLMEGLAHGLARKPISTLLALPLALFGRARLKARIRQLTPDLAVELLPLHADVLAYLQAEQARGRTLHLVTAADEQAAAKVALRFGLFESVLGSDGMTNLKGAAKGAALQARFPEGFAYAGDSFADLAVWSGAQAGVFVGWKRGVEARLRQRGLPLEAAFAYAAPRWRDWRRTLTLQSWLLNLLIFSPLALGAEIARPTAWFAAFCAYWVAGMTASGVRILAELTDLENQRRGLAPAGPFATGAIPLAHGFVASLTLLGLALILAAWHWTAFAAALALFAASLFAHYKLDQPDKPLLDTLAVALTQILRLVMGLLAIGAAAG